MAQKKGVEAIVYRDYLMRPEANGDQTLGKSTIAKRTKGRKTNRVFKMAIKYLTSAAHNYGGR